MNFFSETTEYNLKRVLLDSEICQHVVPKNKDFLLHNSSSYQNQEIQYYLIHSLYSNFINCANNIIYSFTPLPPKFNTTSSTLFGYAFPLF